MAVHLGGMTSDVDEFSINDPLYNPWSNGVLGEYTFQQPGAKVADGGMDNGDWSYAPWFVNTGSLEDHYTWPWFGVPDQSCERPLPFSTAASTAASVVEAAPSRAGSSEGGSEPSPSIGKGGEGSENNSDADAADVADAADADDADGADPDADDADDADDGEGNAEGQTQPKKLKNKRPCRGKRLRWKRIIARLTEMVTEDPFGFDVEKIWFPGSLIKRDDEYAQIVKEKMRAMKEELMRELEKDGGAGAKAKREQATVFAEEAVAVRICF